MREDDQCLALFELMFVTANIDPRVELKIDVNASAKHVLKKFAGTMDSRVYK